MRKFRFLGALAALLVFSGIASGAESALSKIPLRVMSFNIKGLPTFALGGEYKDERYALIGKLLAERGRKGTGPDLVLLQEAFSGLSETLIRASGYPFRSHGPGAASLLGVSSGLYILSRFPVLEEASRAFDPKDCVSWDCFANKGVQFARIRVPGLPEPLEVFNTHLQSGREDSVARRNQVKALLAFYEEKHRAGSPVIFGGDFNFRPGLGQESFKSFSGGTGFANAGKFCLDHGCAKQADSGWHGIWARAVDHQFYAGGGGVELMPTSIERTYRNPERGLRLSDHPAQEVSYELRLSTALAKKSLRPNRKPAGAPKP